MSRLRAHTTPEAYQARARGENIRPILEVEKPDGVVHLMFGIGCRCTTVERMNATSELGGVTCRLCLRHVRHGIAQNLATKERYVQRGVPSMYRDKGVTMADITTGRDALIAHLANFDRIHPGISR